MKITLNVTKEDIKKGKETLQNKKILYTGNCPVALALKRTKFCKNDKMVSVTNENVFMGGAFYSFPKRISDWIRKFDQKKPVGPFRTTIELKRE